MAHPESLDTKLLSKVRPLQGRENCIQMDDLEAVRARYNSAVRRYVREFEKTASLLLLASNSEEDMNRYREHRKREREAREHLDNLRKMYLEALQSAAQREDIAQAG